MTPRQLPIASWALILVFVAACRQAPTAMNPQQQSTGTGPARPALTATALPELGGVEPALQQRIRDRFASLAVLRGREDVPAPDLGAAYGEAGKLLMAAEFYGDAEPYLRNARTLQPGEMAWPYYLAHMHRLRNEPDRAIDAFEETLRLRADFVPALVWLGTLHLDAGRPDAAEPLLQKALGLQPRSAAARFAAGRLRLATGDNAGAVRELEAALAADPSARTVHYSLAMAYRGLGDTARADLHLKQWKDGPLYPADALMEEIGALLQTAVAYEVRGTRALDARKWQEAAALFRKGLEAAPRDATLHQNLGTALYLGGDEPAALAEFQEALRLSPAYGRAHFSVGVLMESRGRDADAITRYTDAVRFDPTLADARFSLAEALRRNGRAGEALPHYQAIVDGDPGASQARFGHAMALVRLKRYGEARTALEAAAAAHPDQPGLAHALARVLAASPDDGVRDGRRALSIVERLRGQYGATSTLLETEAMALAEAGRFKDAAARQRDAIAKAGPEGRAEAAARLRDNLQRYEAGLPCRVPWSDDDPVHRPGVRTGPTT